MAQDDSPRTPPGWEQYSGALIRLASANERAVAWLVPEYGANCVAFMVRVGNTWVDLLHDTGPEALAERPSRFGCPILFPFPGHMRDFRYQWQGRTLTIPRRGSAAPSFTHGFAHTHAWRVMDVGPDHATLAFSTTDGLAPDQRAGYPFAVRLTETVSLRGETLQIDMQATNEGADVAPVGIGLHPYFAAAALGGNRTRVHVELPGRTEHVLAQSVPTGEKRPVTLSQVTVPPMGETTNVVRTDLAPGSRATLADPTGARTIVFAFIAGVRDVVYFAPTDQPSISVEPHTCAPGAASQPEGYPDGLMPLAPGATLAMTVELTLRSASG